MVAGSSPRAYPLSPPSPLARRIAPPFPLSSRPLPARRRTRRGRRVTPRRPSLPLPLPPLPRPGRLDPAGPFPFRAVRAPCCSCEGDLRRPAGGARGTPRPAGRRPTGSAAAPGRGPRPRSAGTRPRGRGTCSASTICSASSTGTRGSLAPWITISGAVMRSTLASGEMEARKSRWVSSEPYSASRSARRYAPVRSRKVTKLAMPTTSTAARHSVGVLRDGRERHVAAVGAAHDADRHAALGAEAARQGREVGDGVQAQLDVVEVLVGAAVARGAADVRRRHGQPASGEVLDHGVQRRPLLRLRPAVHPAQRRHVARAVEQVWHLQPVEALHPLELRPPEGVGGEPAARRARQPARAARGVEHPDVRWCRRAARGAAPARCRRARRPARRARRWAGRPRARRRARRGRSPAR